MRISLVLACTSISSAAFAQAPSGPRVADTTLERAVLAAALDALRSVGTPLPGPYAPFCVRFSDRALADTPNLGQLPLKEGPVLHQTDCPRSYASWVRVVDSAGRDITPAPPPGHVEPYEASVWRPVLLSPGIMVVRMHITRRLETRIVHCEVSVPDTRNAYCGTLLQMVH
jgi:hypothetical protein